MGSTEMRWWHVCLGTLGSWLPGDPRGFRDRWHRVHSSGDYRVPPPAGEHEGLYKRSKGLSGSAVVLQPNLTDRLLNALRSACKLKEQQLLAASVAEEHAHLLIKLHNSYGDAKLQLGRIKGRSSHQLRDLHPGRIWSAGSSPKPIRDREHFQNTFWYIFTGQEAQASMWADVAQWRRWYPTDPRLLEFDATQVELPPDATPETRD